MPTNTDALRVAREALKRFVRHGAAAGAFAADGEAWGPIRFNTDTGYREVPREDFSLAREALAQLDLAGGEENVPACYECGSHELIGPICGACNPELKLAMEGKPAPLTEADAKWIAASIRATAAKIEWSNPTDPPDPDPMWFATEYAKAIISASQRREE